jgi:hypothetical protein
MPIVILQDKVTLSTTVMPTLSIMPMSRPIHWYDKRDAISESLFPKCNHFLLRSKVLYNPFSLDNEYNSLKSRESFLALLHKFVKLLNYILRAVQKSELLYGLRKDVDKICSVLIRNLAFFKITIIVC